MSKIDIVVATAHCYAQPDPSSWYVTQLIREDMYVVEAFQKLGLNAVRKGWDDPDFDWSQTKAVLIRTTWNYCKHFEKFEAWLSLVSSRGKLFNSLDVIRWNIDKHYLGYLQNHGVNAVTTLYPDKPVQLAQVMKDYQWDEIIIKPVVSAAAFHTYRIDKSNVSEYQPVFEKLMAEKQMMIQPFQKDVLEHGEISCIVIGHRFSHAIRKLPKAGDFRVQDEYGGKICMLAPTEEEKRFAESAIAASPHDVVYARVDFVRDNQGKMAVMELELIEPELFFRIRPESAKELASAVKRSL